VASSAGRTGAGNIAVVGLGARGTPGAPVEPLNVTALFDGTGDDADRVALSGVTATSPWDLVHVLFDSEGDLVDRLFVALQDGTVAVFDDFLQNILLGNPPASDLQADRYFLPQFPGGLSAALIPAVNL